jgi:hypothetical protein
MEIAHIINEPHVVVMHNHSTVGQLLVDSRNEIAADAQRKCNGDDPECSEIDKQSSSNHKIHPFSHQLVDDVRVNEITSAMNRRASEKVSKNLPKPAPPHRPRIDLRVNFLPLTSPHQ